MKNYCSNPLLVSCFHCKISSKMSTTIATSRAAVVSFLEQCETADYVYDIVHIQTSGTGTVNEFRVTWSKPRPDCPIPRAVVKQTIYIDAKEGKEPTITYRIENETHIIHPTENLMFSSMWLDKVIERKIQMKKFFDCTTKTDASRLK